MAIERTVANSNPKAAAAAVAAAKAANAPAPELAAAVNRVATCLGGVYFLTSLGNPQLDPFRCDSVNISTIKTSVSFVLLVMDLESPLNFKNYRNYKNRKSGILGNPTGHPNLCIK